MSPTTAATSSCFGTDVCGVASPPTASPLFAKASIEGAKEMEDNHAINISTIPPELVINILEYLRSDNASSKSPYTDLLPVTQTSSQLRQTALSAPSLWSTIEINDKPSSFNFAKLCLARSGNHKLDISIRVLKKIEIKIKGLLALLEYASSRIRSLSMKLSFTGPEQWDLWWDSWKALQYGALEDFNLEMTRHLFGV
ncbi:hypothetical protein M407DRAFT_20114 [Tulasnella calospora MUT 4182]|uniref:Uncharacterized protein n=1 Tax=Tulasnella calospora MUT 4182 TaxID=1051891 RepID=A0A0C3QS80_9AGAM|nr:hypothetical protein M407DRAFT_20114 [Tulasnella calospora MUT 4182]